MDATESSADNGHSPGRAVVLGGTGFVGRPVCRALAQRGFEVVAVARHNRMVPHATAIVPMDLARADQAEIATMLREHDAALVVNAAGGMWGLSDDEMVFANTTLTEHVIGAVAALPHRPRLVHIGTVHEYGMVPIGASMDEETEPKPVTLYGQLKLRCTEAVLAATEAGEVDGVVLRVGNVTGTGQPAVSLLGIVAERLAEAHRERRTAVLDLAPLGAKRDFLNLGDAVSAITAAATTPALRTPLMNIGTGHATSARDMVQALIEVSGVPTELNEAAATAEETTWQQMRVERAMKHLAWAPSPSLTDGLRELWAHVNDDATLMPRSLV